MVRASTRELRSSPKRFLAKSERREVRILPSARTTVSIGFAISIGLLAGLYPSISASRLEPVEALRA